MCWGRVRFEWVRYGPGVEIHSRLFELNTVYILSVPKMIESQSLTHREPIHHIGKTVLRN